MKLNAKMLGGKEMVKLVQDIAKKFPDDVMKAMYKEAEIEVTEMKRRCPVDTTDDAPHPGNLRASIHVEKPVREGRTLTVTFATGQQAPYAIYVHENPDAFHPVGEWKFMEGPIKEATPYFAARIAKRANFKHADGKEFMSSDPTGGE